MRRSLGKENIEKYRVNVARKVRDLRRLRRWTQAELADHLELSQSRLSEIECGDGSFTAEQFLTVLALFNVTASDFAPSTKSNESEIQNALVRLGAQHLHANADALPSERLKEIGSVIRETLVTAESPRLITALSAVVVRGIDAINLRKLDLQLAEVGLERRFRWFVESTLVAARQALPSLPRPLVRHYRRAETVLENFVDAVTSVDDASSSRDVVPDLLDRDIRSRKTRDEVEASSSAISKRWRIITNIQPEDFVAALRAARIDD